MLIGVGPVVVFGASNFPLAISVAGTDTIRATVEAALRSLVDQDTALHHVARLRKRGALDIDGVGSQQPISGPTQGIGHRPQGGVEGGDLAEALPGPLPQLLRQQGHDRALETQDGVGDLVDVEPVLLTGLGDPRGVLKKQLKRAEDMGYIWNAGPELEFFLFRKDEEGTISPLPHDRGGYFDFSTDLAQAVRIRTGESGPEAL